MWYTKLVISDTRYFLRPSLRASLVIMAILVCFLPFKRTTISAVYCVVVLPLLFTVYMPLCTSWRINDDEITTKKKIFA